MAHFLSLPAYAHIEPLPFRGAGRYLPAGPRVVLRTDGHPAGEYVYSRGNRPWVYGDASLAYNTYLLAETRLTSGATLRKPYRELAAWLANLNGRRTIPSSVNGWKIISRKPSVLTASGFTRRTADVRGESLGRI